MVRTLCGYDIDRYTVARRWPLREALISMEFRAREQALAQYRWEMAIWAALAPHSKNSKQPKPPEVLIG
jgi:hypothetical protein